MQNFQPIWFGKLQRTDALHSFWEEGILCGAHPHVSLQGNTIAHSDCNLPLLSLCQLITASHLDGHVKEMVNIKQVMLEQDMAGKVVVITGASSGIGRAAANRLAAAGATVVGTSRYPWRYPKPGSWELW